MHCIICQKEAMPGQEMCGKHLLEKNDQLTAQEKESPENCINCGNAVEDGIQVFRKLLSESTLAGSVCSRCCSNMDKLKLVLKREDENIRLEAFGKM